MTPRERFVAWMLGEPVDRPPFWLFWPPWARTRERWAREGLAPGEDFRAAFAPDPAPRVLPVNCGPCPRLERVVLEEDEHAIVHTDSWGIVRRDLKGGESMSQFLQFPVQGRSDWERFRETHLDPDHPARLDGDWRELAAQWSAAGVPIQLGDYPDVAVFGALRWLLGDEECLIAFHTMPELVHEIMDHLTDIYLTVFAAVVAEVQVDVIHIWEDMCGRQGPLISPRHWEEFMGSNYRRIRDFARRHDIRLISVDTDGDPALIAPPMMAAGVNYLLPMEVAAGCDVVDWQRRFPGLAMMGGIDKRALALDRAAIDAELDRVWPAVEAGRYIPDLDHLVPDDVPWDNYRYYAEALRRRIMG